MTIIRLLFLWGLVGVCAGSPGEKSHRGLWPQPDKEITAEGAEERREESRKNFPPRSSASSAVKKLF